jgi:hypothetical protein
MNGLELIGTKTAVTNKTEMIFSDCFSANYDNYLFVVRGLWTSSPGCSTWLQLHDGSNPVTSGYTAQFMEFNNTAKGAARASENGWFTGRFTNPIPTGQHLYVYGPALLQPTAYRSVVASANNTASIRDDAGTQSSPTSYSSARLYTNSSIGFDASVTIYGFTKQSVV